MSTPTCLRRHRLGGLRHHAVKHLASPQQAVAVSSGDVVLAGVVTKQGASEGLGSRSIALGLGCGLELRIRNGL